MNPNLSESDFSPAAERILDFFLDTLHSKDHLAPNIGGVSIFEPNTAPIVLYYLRKGLTLRGTGKQVAHAGPDRWHQVAWQTAWFCREMWLSLSGSVHPNLRQADILFVCNVVRQHESIAPVLARLAEDGLNMTIISKPPLPIPLRIHRANVHYRDWSALRHPRYWRELVKKSREWKHYLAKDLKQQLTESGTGFVEQWIHDRSLQAVRSLLLAQDVVTDTSPSVIVTTDPADAEAKAFTAIGKKRGIPSFCLQYGLAGPHDSEWHYFDQDYVGTLDSYSVKTLVARGIPRDRVLLTGNPRYDSYRPDPEKRNLLRTQLHIPDSLPLVVFFSTPPALEITGTPESYLTVDDHENVLQAVYNLAKGRNRFFLAIKTHPEEWKRPHEMRLRSLSTEASQVRLVQNLTSYDLINAADVVITTHSTTGLEAIYLDKPLITLNLTGRPDQYDYAESGAAAAVRSADQLEPMILELLRTSESSKSLAVGRQKYRERNPFLGRDKSSAGRCAAIIQALKNREPIPPDS